MRVSIIAAASLLGLAALPSAAQAQPGPYVARGTEPFWSLTIGARTMRFEAPDRPTVTVTKPKPAHGFAGDTYRTGRLTVNIVHRACSDGMSDRTYPDSVTVFVGRRAYKGCGGEAREAGPGRVAIEGSWRIESLHGRPVAPTTSPSVTFRDGRMSGNASCNRFTGSYRFERGRLTAGPLAGTKMFCSQRVQNVQESTILGLFGERLTVRSERGGKLVLTNDRGAAAMVLAPEGRR